MTASLIDELAAGNVDLETLTLSDLGIDLNSLGWVETEEGILSAVVRENDKHAMNLEEEEWVARVLDTCRVSALLLTARVYSPTMTENPCNRHRSHLHSNRCGAGVA